MLRAEFAEAIEEFVEDTMREVHVAKDCVTRHDFLVRINTDSRIAALRSSSKSDLRDALAQVFEFVTMQGRRACVKHKARRQCLGWKPFVLVCSSPPVFHIADKATYSITT
jgi:hypothetical protein